MLFMLMTQHAALWLFYQIHVLNTCAMNFLLSYGSKLLCMTTSRLSIDVIKYMLHSVYVLLYLIG